MLYRMFSHNPAHLQQSKLQWPKLFTNCFSAVYTPAMFLSVEGLSLTIDGKKLLDSISFSAEKGTITLLSGLNGAGKSLLIRSLKGLENPESGKIILSGRELTKRKERMKAFALVFQDTALGIVGSTVEKDIAFGPQNLGRSHDEVAETVDEQLAFFSLEEKRKTRPAVLSGGEKRKLAIAGVIAMQPEVILLDEPFANLDYPSTLTVIRTLIKLKETGHTIIVVSHEAEKFLAHTDMTIILEKGRIKASGRSRDMIRTLRDNNVYLPADASFEELTWLR